MQDGSSFPAGAHAARRWPTAAALALVIEGGLIALALHWIRPSAPPPPLPVVQIVLQAPVTRRTVAPPKPHPALPRPKPIVKPRPHPLPRPVHHVRPKPITPLPPRPAARPKPSPASASAPVIPQTPPALVTASVRANFEAALHDAIQAALRYPAAALLMRLGDSTVVVAFRYYNGHVGAVHIAKSCGIPMLDRAALQAVRTAQYPQTPAVLMGRHLEYDIDVQFTLSTQ